MFIQLHETKIFAIVIFVMLAIAYFTGCGSAPVDPNALANQTPTPAPATQTQVQTTAISPDTQNGPQIDPSPTPDSKLWLDPFTGLYWYLAGLGNVDKALNLCYGDYRPADYYELYHASLDGLGKFDPKITQIWSLSSAYYDPLTGLHKTYFVDLGTSTMIAGSDADIRGLACIWMPKN